MKSKKSGPLFGQGNLVSLINSLSIFLSISPNRTSDVVIAPMEHIEDLFIVIIAVEGNKGRHAYIT